MLAPTMTTDSDGNHERDARPAAPTRPSPPPTPVAHDDEVSLRELYLIVKRGLPLIVTVALVAAVVTFLAVILAPDRFESEATVVSAPTTVQVQGEGTLAFEPRSAITFATYEDIAISRATFERTLASLRDGGAATPDGPRDLLAAATVERLTGPSNANDSTPLTVVHRISWSDAQLAARYADAWAEATVEQVRSTLLADLEPARVQTVEALEAREATLAEAEAAYRTFQAQDLPGIQQELRTVGERIAASEDGLTELDRTIAGLTAQREALLAMNGFATSGAAGASAETLDLLADTERLDPAVAAQLRLLATTPGDDATGGGAAGDSTRVDDAIALLRRADLHAITVELAGALQEREQLRSALATSEARAETLRDRVAELRQEDARLSRRLSSASAAYQAVQAIEPALAFVANLTPGNTRVLNDAQEPTEPTGPSARLLALIAAVVAGLAATLFVFLREAVREPADDRASAPSQNPRSREAAGGA